MTNISPNFNSTLYQYPQNIGYNVPSRGFEDLKKQDNMAGKVAGTVSSEEGFWSNLWGITRRTFYGVLMSMGFVHLANWSMKTPNITASMNQIDAYQASRLYQAGAKLDNFGPLKWLATQGGKLKTQLARIPVPNFLREAWGKMKIGTVSAWDSTGMYSIGKAAEAMKESLEFFSKVDDAALKSLTSDTTIQNEIVSLIQKFRAGKINHLKAFKEFDSLLKQGNVSAKAIDAISKQTGTLSKILGTTQNLNTSLSKARFFAGLNNKGPVSKALNKAFSLWTEASGGGVLGGNMCLFMNALGLTTAFAAAKDAEKGDKLKAFMEDYWGFTIGGYVGSMFVGKLFHRFLGLGENGMRLNSKECQDAISKLGLEGAERVQDAVIAYNKEFKSAKTLEKYLEKLNNGKIVDGGGWIFGWIKRKLFGQMTTAEAQKALANVGIVSADAKVAQATIEAEAKKFVNARSMDSYFKPIREKLISAMKMPDIKFGDIFKGGGGFTEKTTIKRLGEWIMKKPVANLAKLMGTGKYTLLTKGNFFGNAFRSLKRVGGGIGRMWLVGFVLVEPFRNLAMKMSHKVFGKPKKSQFDELNNKNKKGQEVQQFPNAQNQGIRQIPVEMQNIPQQSQNLINLYTQNIQKNNPNATKTTPTAQKEKQQSSQNKGIEKLKADNATYIPNQVLGQESYIDPGVTQDLLLRRDMALYQADAAERNAREVLSRF